MKTNSTNGPEVFDANGNPLNEVIVKSSPISKILVFILLLTNIITAYSLYKTNMQYEALYKHYESIDKQYQEYFGTYTNPITYEPITSAKAYIDAYQAQESLANTTVTYVIDRSNRVFHIMSCEYADKINVNFRSVVESSDNELKRQGYRPCQYCIGE